MAEVCRGLLLIVPYHFLDPKRSLTQREGEEVPSEVLHRGMELNPGFPFGNCTLCV